MSIAKKIFIISSVLFSAALFFLGIYNISFKKEKTSVQTEIKTTQDETANDNKSALDKIGEAVGIENKEKIYSLSDEAVIGPIVTDDGEKIEYYSRTNGNVFKVFSSGEGKETISSSNLLGLENILWSSDGSKVISCVNNNGNLQYSTYDYKAKKGNKLSDGVELAVWSNLGDKLFYNYFEAKTRKRTLNIADPDGKNWKKIADVNFSNTFISAVPQSSLVSFWNSPNAFEETSLNVVSSLGGEAKKIFSGKFGADYLWSPDGTKALISSTDLKGGSKISLGSINSKGGEFQNLNVPTFVSKCAWSKDSKTVFYALPSFSSDSSVLPNDYQNGKVSTKDTFWKLDVASGKAERIVEIKDIKEAYDATSLFLNPSEDILFFINKSNGRLYGINL